MKMAIQFTDTLATDPGLGRFLEISDFGSGLGLWVPGSALNASPTKDDWAASGDLTIAGTPGATGLALSPSAYAELPGVGQSFYTGTSALTLVFVAKLGVSTVLIDDYDGVTANPRISLYSGNVTSGTGAVLNMAVGSGTGTTINISGTSTDQAALTSNWSMFVARFTSTTINLKYRRTAAAAAAATGTRTASAVGSSTVPLRVGRVATGLASPSGTLAAVAAYSAVLTSGQEDTLFADLVAMMALIGETL